MGLTSTGGSTRGAGNLNIWMRLAIALVFGALLAAGVGAFSPGLFWSGWLAAAVLLVPGLFVLVSAWQWGAAASNQRERWLLAWLVGLAFLLRLVIGVGLSLALPVWGYAEKEQQAGYLFKDAYYRDHQAWDLAQSGKPIWASFREEFATDQYGGLLALSALVYRSLSPDAHRPFLLLILGAFFAALGVPFLWRSARLRWSGRVAMLAAWIYVLYPDALYFSSSQMREPFLVGLSAVAFWSLLSWDFRRPSTWLALLGSLLGMALISSRVAAAMAGLLGLLFLLEYVINLPDRRWRFLGWAALGVGVLLVLAFSWEWFRSSASWDMRVTYHDSGRVMKTIREFKSMANLPRDEVEVIFLTGYGLTRPLLPAAIAESAGSALWKSIAIVRSAGWYGLAPFLVYSLFWIWKERDARTRRLAIWLALGAVLWLLIASARAGGDSTDNPRYRSQFILWLALLAAWSVDWALAHHDAWLWRWMIIEAIFLGFFTHYYLGTYYRLWLKMPFWSMLVWIGGLSGLVLVGGWAWDRWAAHRQASKTRLPASVE
jgi:hypothetical protein